MDDSSLRALCDSVEAWAARAAELMGVTGVETRDPFLPNVDLEFDRPALPELIAYCEPTHANEVRAQLEVWTRAAPVDVVWRQTEHALEGEDDWRDRWKQFYQPIVFRNRLLLRPSWVERQPEHPKSELVLDPGRAFGTGLHASTRLCIEHLLDLSERRTVSKASRVLDLGCGSGILGLAAVRLLPTIDSLVMSDIDEDSVEVARENAQLNLITAQFEVASAAALRPPGAGFDLVLANIRPRVLLPDAATITATVAKGGCLVLSGILDEELEAITDRYVQLGFVLEACHAFEGWSSPRLRAPEDAT